MPTYTYKCSECQNKLEADQKMSDPHLTHCPKCGRSALKRVPSLVSGFSLNGSGFYETDYKGSSGGCCPCGKNTSCG